MVLNYYNTIDKSQFTKKRILFKAISFYLVAQAIVMTILGVFFLYLKYKNIDTEPFYPKTSKNEISDKWYLIIFFAPILEEFAFRFGLSFKKNQINLSISVLCFILLSVFVGGYTNHIILKLTVCLLVFLSLKFVSQSFWTTFSVKYGQLTIVIITTLFGFLHLYNFELSLIFLPIYLFLCFPQIVMGITFAYLRLNAGFIYALIAHIIVNGFSVLFEIM